MKIDSPSLIDLSLAKPQDIIYFRNGFKTKIIEIKYIVGDIFEIKNYHNYYFHRYRINGITDGDTSSIYDIVKIKTRNKLKRILSIIFE